MRERSEDFLERYGISTSNGFLPADRPLKRLSASCYEPWEDLAANLPRLISDGQARSKIDSLPVLETAQLTSEAEWRRAYVIMGFLTHAYIWGGEQPAQRLPPQLTRPFLTVSEHFGLPPIMTFSTLSLWNFGLESPRADITNPESLRSLLSFTGTGDEEWFYMISTAIEAKGALLISTALRCIQAVDVNDDSAVLSNLQSLTSGIQEIGQLLRRMHERCDPQVFYHNVRPFCAGTKDMAAAGLPNGVFYDEGNGRGKWMQHSGGSNAQSSLIQLFDIFLCVDHNAPGGQAASPRASGKSKGYLQEMRSYMPAPHREFLAQVERLSNVRDYASRSGASAELLTAYNDAVTALTTLRNIHIQIVARYIVMPSRSPPAPHIVTRKGKNLATACSSKQTGKPDENASATRQLHGTGGTSVMPFLKRTRDETSKATISTGI